MLPPKWNKHRFSSILLSHHTWQKTDSNKQIQENNIMGQGSYFPCGAVIILSTLIHLHIYLTSTKLRSGSTKVNDMHCFLVKGVSELNEPSQKTGNEKKKKTVYKH